MSAAAPAAHCAISRPVDGSRTANVSPDCAGTHLPPINSCWGRDRKPACSAPIREVSRAAFISSLLRQLVPGHPESMHLPDDPVGHLDPCDRSGLEMLGIDQD